MYDVKCLIYVQPIIFSCCVCYINLSASTSICLFIHFSIRIIYFNVFWFEWVEWLEMDHNSNLSINIVTLYSNQASHNIGMFLDFLHGAMQHITTIHSCIHYHIFQEVNNHLHPPWYYEHSTISTATVVCMCTRVQ